MIIGKVCTPLRLLGDCFKTAWRLLRVFISSVFLSVSLFVPKRSRSLTFWPKKSLTYYLYFKVTLKALTTLIWNLKPYQNFFQCALLKSSVLFYAFTCILCFLVILWCVGRWEIVNSVVYIFHMFLYSVRLSELLISLSVSSEKSLHIGKLWVMAPHRNFAKF